jgi:hypothetical protein
MNIDPSPVLTVRGMVSSAAWLATFAMSRDGERRHSSRIRSKTTTESFTDRPMMVKAAARKMPSMGLPSHAKMPTTMITSWNIASTAEAPIVHLNRIPR